jgi:hypothetical protein
VQQQQQQPPQRWHLLPFLQLHLHLQQRLMAAAA